MQVDSVTTQHPSHYRLRPMRRRSSPERSRLSQPNQESRTKRASLRQRRTSNSSGDRVAVSPLDGAHASEYGFKNLAIGGGGYGLGTTAASESTTTATAASARPEPAIADPMSTGWTSSLPSAITSGSAGGSSRFGGKGGSLDDEDANEGDGGLFGKVGPACEFPCRRQYGTPPLRMIRRVGAVRMWRSSLQAHPYKSKLRRL